MEVDLQNNQYLSDAEYEHPIFYRFDLINPTAIQRVAEIYYRYAQQSLSTPVRGSINRAIYHSYASLALLEINKEGISQRHLIYALCRVLAAYESIAKKISPHETKTPQSIATTTRNDLTAKQTYIPVRYDLLPIRAIQEVAKVLHEGALKYGDTNYMTIPFNSHLNHALNHLYGALAALDNQDDRTLEELSHAACRLLFAYTVNTNSSFIYW